MPDFFKTKMLNFGEVLIASLKIFGKYYKFIFIISLLSSMPINLLMRLSNLSNLDRYINFLNATNLTVEHAAEIIIQVSKFLTLSFTLQIIFGVLMTGGLTFIVSQFSLDRKVTLGGVFDHSILKWPRLVYTSFLTALLLFVVNIIIIVFESTLASLFNINPYTLFLIYIILLLYITICFLFSVNIAAITGSYGIVALKKSIILVKGNALYTTLILIVTNLFSVIFTLSLTIDKFSPNPTIDLIMNTLYSSFLTFSTSFFSIPLLVHFINLLHIKSDKVNSVGKTTFKA